MVKHRRRRRSNHKRKFNLAFLEALRKGNSEAMYEIDEVMLKGAVKLRILEISNRGTFEVARTVVKARKALTDRERDALLYTFFQSVVSTMMLGIDDTIFRNNGSVREAMQVEYTNEVNRVIIVDMDTERDIHLQLLTLGKNSYPRTRAHETHRDDEGDLIALTYALASHIRGIEDNGNGYALGEAMSQAVSLLNELYTDTSLEIKNAYESNTSGNPAK
jgi:hypothetical protein